MMDEDDDDCNDFEQYGVDCIFCSGSSQKLTSRDLTQFAHHVARGMEYLSSKKVDDDDDDDDHLGAQGMQYLSYKMINFDSDWFQSVFK